MSRERSIPGRIAAAAERIRSLPQWNIRLKFALLVCFLALFLGIFSGWSSVSKVRALLLHGLEEKGMAISRYVAYNAWYGVYAGDKDVLKNLTVGVLQEKDVSYVVIVGSNGELLAQSSRSGAPPPHVLHTLPLRVEFYEPRSMIAEDTDGSRFLQVLTPILRGRETLGEDESLLWESEGPAAAGDEKQKKKGEGDKFLGYVVVGMPHERISEQLGAIAPGIAVATFLAVVLGIGFVLVLLRVIMRPLKTMAETAQRIASGDLTQEVRATSKDEIGTLAESFNTMVSALRARDRRIQANQRMLEASNQELKKLDKRKSEFLANMSHELRTPLNAIIGFSEVLRDRCFGDLTAKQNEYVEDILESGCHLLLLINDVLDLSKIEAGMLHLEKHPVDLKALLERSVVVVKEKASKCGIPVSVETHDLPKTIIADERKLKQVVYNLLANAVKFTGEGGSVGINASPRGDAILVEVWDTGIGIPEEDREKVFSKFEQLDGSASRKYEGTGLGLSLAKSMIELHGGRIWVEGGAEGRGSRFRFTLPCAASGEEDPAWSDDSVARALGDSTTVACLFPKTSEGPRILHIEDQAATAGLLRTYLASAGYTPEAARGGKEGLRKASENPPDIVLLDLLLPDMDGWEVLARLKKDPVTRDVPVIIGSIVDDREKGFSLGAVDYLVKPIGREDLLSTLERVLAAGDPSGRAARLLVIDADPAVGRTIEKGLADRSVEVLRAQNGEDGIRIAGDEIPDLVFLAFTLPDMTCVEAVRTLRGNPVTKEIPIALVIGEEVAEKEKSEIREEVQFFSRKSELSRDGVLAEIESLLQSGSRCGNGAV